jgi:hypothetical protein
MTTREQQEYMDGIKNQDDRRLQKLNDKYIEIVEKATRQLEYNILCLGDEEILVLNRLIHGYLISQGVHSSEQSVIEEVEE